MNPAFRSLSTCTQSHPRRCGVAMFTVIVILAVVTMVVGSTLGRLVLEHRQCRLRHEERQCCRVALAALDRAAALHAADNAYTGETWTIAAADLGRNENATVDIRLDNRVVTATVMYPAGKAPRVRRTETRLLQ